MLPRFPTVTPHLPSPSSRSRKGITASSRSPSRRALQAGGSNSRRTRPLALRPGSVTACSPSAAAISPPPTPAPPHPQKAAPSRASLARTITGRCSPTPPPAPSRQATTTSPPPRSGGDPPPRRPAAATVILFSILKVGSPSFRSRPSSSMSRRSFPTSWNPPKSRLTSSPFPPARTEPPLTISTSA